MGPLIPFRPERTDVLTMVEGQRQAPPPLVKIRPPDALTTCVAQACHCSQVGLHLSLTLSQMIYHVDSALFRRYLSHPDTVDPEPEPPPEEPDPEPPQEEHNWREEFMSTILAHGTLSPYMLSLIERHIYTEEAQAIYDAGQEMVFGDVSDISVHSPDGAGMCVSKGEQRNCHKCGGHQHKAKRPKLRRFFRMSKAKFLVCAGCKGTSSEVHYCSRSCQKADWDDHKAVCRK